MKVAEGPCARCRAHPASQIHAESVMEYMHGHYESWCECCVLNDLIRRAEAAAHVLPEWQRQLAAACDGEALPNQQDLIEENTRLRAEGYRQWLAAHGAICGPHYPGQHAMNYAAPHPDGEHCYWPEPVERDN